MRVVGTRQDRAISVHARGDLLREGALFNTDLQKLHASLRFPKGLFRYKTAEEADRHWTACIVANVVEVRRARHGK